MAEEFDWERLFNSRRRRLLVTSERLEQLGITQEYWSMVEFFGDLRHEHRDLWGEHSVEDAVALGMQALDARYAISCKNSPSREHLERDKALLDKVVRDIYSGDPVASQIDRKMDDLRGGIGEIYRSYNRDRQRGNRK